MDSLENPSILSHISVGTNDFENAVAFYDRVLPTLGCKRWNIQGPSPTAGSILSFGYKFPTITR
jgi:hypothetical protein